MNQSAYAHSSLLAYIYSELAPIFFRKSKVYFIFFSTVEKVVRQIDQLLIYSKQHNRDKLTIRSKIDFREHSSISSTFAADSTA